MERKRESGTSPHAPHLEHLVERNAILDATAAAEMEAALNARVRAVNKPEWPAEASASICALRARARALAGMAAPSVRMTRVARKRLQKPSTKSRWPNSKPSVKPNKPLESQAGRQVAEATRLFDEVQARRASAWRWRPT